MRHSKQSRVGAALALRTGSHLISPQYIGPGLWLLESTLRRSRLGPRRQRWRRLLPVSVAGQPAIQALELAGWVLARLCWSKAVQVA